MPQSERHVRQIRNGKNMAVRIPRGFELEGEEAILPKDGGRLIVMTADTGVFSRLPGSSVENWVTE